MRRQLFFCVALFCFSFAQAQKGGKSFSLVIGTYTNKDKTNGIHVYRFNNETGEFTEKSKALNVTNPSFLVVSNDKKFLYAVSEEGNGNGKVNSFSFDAKSGAMNYINSVPSAGDHPCYISVDKRSKFVFVGNYSSGTLSAIPIQQDGSLNADMQTITHSGSSVNTSRQDKPHVHAALLSPDERYLFVPDLGTDKVNIYSVNVKNSKPLTASSNAVVKPGSGPRHLTFHPKGKLAYLVQELDASVTVFDYSKGKLLPKQNISMLAPDFKGNVGAADIHVSPDGKFLYASNRGDANEIAIYAIGKDGKLTYVGGQSTLGKTPRNFAIDPSGNFLLAANQNSDAVIIFKRDQKTGVLTDTGKKIMVDRPVCLKFVSEN